MNLDKLQPQMEGLLKANSFFEGIDILSEKKGNIENLVKQYLGKIGVSVVILSPYCNSIDPSRGKVVYKASLEVRVFERPLINQGSRGTKKEALAICDEVARTLHGKSNGVSEDPLRTIELNLSQEAIIPMEMPDVTLVAYSVNFETLCPL